MVRAEYGLLKARFTTLQRGASIREWRRLQYDAYCALVHAQVRLVELHSELVTVLRADRTLYEAHRNESLELSLACASMRELTAELLEAIARAEAGN